MDHLISALNLNLGTFLLTTILVIETFILIILTIMLLRSGKNEKREINGVLKIIEKALEKVPSPNNNQQFQITLEKFYDLEERVKNLERLSTNKTNLDNEIMNNKE